MGFGMMHLCRFGDHLALEAPLTQWLKAQLLMSDRTPGGCFI